MEERFAVSYVKNERVVSTYFNCENDREKIRFKVIEICGVDIRHSTHAYEVSIIKLGTGGYIYH